jgi:hypothetical protein
MGVVQLLTNFQMNLRHLTTTLLAASAWLPSQAFGSSSFFSDSPFCDTFDTLAKSGVPTWKNSAPGFEGWYIQSDSAFYDGNANGFKYRANTGKDSGVGVYSFGTGSSASDRSLGAVTGGFKAASIAFGKLLVNNTSTPITSITVSYTGEQWRSASTSPQSLLFSYAIAPTATGSLYSGAGLGGQAYLSPTVLSGSDASGDNKGLTWNNVPTGAFTSINLGGGGAVSASADINVTLSGINIPPSAAIMLRWVNPSGNTDGLGIDNVCVSINTAAAAVPEPSTYAAIAAVTVMAGASAFRRRKNQNAN